MINLRTNYPSLSEEGDVFKDFVANHLDAEKLLQQPVRVSGEEWFRMLSPALSISSDLLINTSRVQLCNSGTHAILAILSSLRSTHSVIGVEEFTYSGFKTTALMLGYQLEALECDEEGVQPQSIKAALDKGITLFYLQPTIQNPTCSVMSEARRKQIADLFIDTNAMIIEDDAYRFLHPAPPSSFLKLLLQNTIHIYSLSKPFNSFIAACFIILPKEKLPKLSLFIDKTGGSINSLSLLFTQHLLCNAIYQQIIVEKQNKAIAIKQWIQSVLQDCSYKTFPTSYHIWIALPATQNSKAFVEQLEKKDIMVTGSHECSATDNTNFIRIALSAEKDNNILRETVSQIMQMLLS